MDAQHAARSLKKIPTATKLRSGYTSAEIGEAHQALRSKAANSPYWQTRKGRTSAACIEDLGLVVPKE
jgi:hypothetical protein